MNASTSYRHISSSYPEYLSGAEQATRRNFGWCPDTPAERVWDSPRVANSAASRKPLIGVRISWLMLARNSLFALFAASAYICSHLTDDSRKKMRSMTHAYIRKPNSVRLHRNPVCFTGLRERAPLRRDLQYRFHAWQVQPFHNRLQTTRQSEAGRRRHESSSRLPQSC
jgi:hypothetical protein